MKKLNKLHGILRRYKYFYYEKNISLVSDYEYDIIEKEYDSMCLLYNIPGKNRVSNFVGFNIKIPMNII
jgi:NAD-dependent DNA ligase